MLMKTNVIKIRNPKLATVQAQTQKLKSFSSEFISFGHSGFGNSIFGRRASFGFRFSVFGFAAATLLVGCEKKREASSGETIALPSVAVRVTTVANKPYLATEEVVGTVRAKLRATLEAKVSGRIEKMPVVAGQAVKTGDLIAQLDVGEIRARLDQAKAMRDQAERELKRFETLLKDKAVTPQEFEGVQSRYRIAAAGVVEAETMLSYATVTAPFDGIITRKYADVGDLASPGRPLADLEDPTALRIEADVPEAIIGSVSSGAKLPVRVAGAASVLNGTVSEIAPVADPNSRTYRVKLDLAGATGLRVGQFGRVAVPVGETNLPRVPQSAVIQRGQMEIVFIVADGKAHLRLVKTGRRVENEVELLSGVGAGETVVVENAGQLLDGQPVTAK